MVANVDVWPHDYERVWRECNQYWLTVELLGCVAQFMHQSLMPYMDAIEVANGDYDWFGSCYCCFVFHVYVEVLPLPLWLVPGFKFLWHILPQLPLGCNLFFAGADFATSRSVGLFGIA